MCQLNNNDNCRRVDKRNGTRRIHLNYKWTLLSINLLRHSRLCVPTYIYIFLFYHLLFISINIIIPINRSYAERASIV